MHYSSGDNGISLNTEPSMMGDVYQNAIVNIAATSAANSSQGVFRVPDPRELGIGDDSHDC